MQAETTEDAEYVFLYTMVAILILVIVVIVARAFKKRCKSNQQIMYIPPLEEPFL